MSAEGGDEPVDAACALGHIAIPMRARIENVFHITPETFWETLFFDDEYNARLYKELGFAVVEVLALEDLGNGRIRRALRAEPPVNAPDILKKRLKDKLAYEEEGIYDKHAQRWDFTSKSNVAREAAKIGGSITTEPHPEGMLHIVELDVSISALGLGNIIERVIEKNVRESYKVTTRFTNAYAAEKGLLAAQRLANAR